MEKLLVLHDVMKAYSGVTVLKGVNIDLSKGEILGLVGENGAGKSTMINAISGTIKVDGGYIEYFGEKYDSLTPRQAIDLGIATIYQEIDLVDNLSVANNIFLGSEIRGKAGFIDAKEQNRRSAELIKKLGIESIPPEIMLSELSTAQKQCVQIVKALMHDAKVLILDEPTASLGEQETQNLLQLVKKLAADGMGIIFISHFIDEIFAICDKVLILKDGVQVDVRKISETNPDSVINAMIGREAESFYHREYFPCGSRVLKVDHYRNKSTVFDVSFEIKSGEVFGLGGLVGAGRTELIRMIYGADPKITGELYIDDKKITPTSPGDAIRKGIYMISEDRKGEGLLLLRTIKENITVSHVERKEWIDTKAERESVSQSIEDYEIKVRDMDDQVSTLSGGNQQKVVIARCMMDGGDIYIFDEPTKGVDVGAKEDIYKHILNLAKSDKFVIMISSDMPELLSMSDRIGIMREGELVDIVQAKEVTEEILMRKYLGV